MINKKNKYDYIVKRSVALTAIIGASYAGIALANDWGGGIDLIKSISTPEQSHEGHDHSAHEGHDHGSHEGHDHAAPGEESHEEHAAHDDHSDHSGHDHAEHEKEDHSGHDHAAHGEESHEEHAAHDDHSDHSGHDHAEHGDDHSGHDHGSHDDAAYETQDFTNIEIKNMQIKSMTAELGTYIKAEQISATVETIPQNSRPIYAPWSGMVKSISVSSGAAVMEDQRLMTIVRDPIQRIDLNLTGDILRPASEEYHTLTASLRSSQQELSNLDDELARLTKFDDVNTISLLPQKEIREIKYNQSNLKKSIENDLLKLKLHGHVSGENATRYSPQTDKLWLSALKANGIWNHRAEQLYLTLPDSLKNNSWAIATVGELSAASLVTDGLITWLKANNSAAHYIIEIGGLIQQGYTISALKELDSLNVFEQEIIVATPAGDMGWDVDTVDVRVGQHIDAGEELLDLSNNSTMYLVAEPIGSEVSLIGNAMQENYLIGARPLSKNAGPVLSGLSIIKLGAGHDAKQTAFALAENEILSVYDNDDQLFRSWGMRPGTKYVMNVPVDKLDRVFTIPREAVIDAGGASFVFVQEDKRFEKRPVAILYRDTDYAVIDGISELKQGDKVVSLGAFALNLAFLSETPQAIDPHAGHNH